MFLQQADTNSKSLLCLHSKAHSATYEAVGDMPPPSGAQQSMILIAEMRVDNISNISRSQHRKPNLIIHTFFWSYDDIIKFMSYVSQMTCHVFSVLVK